MSEKVGSRSRKLSQRSKELVKKRRSEGRNRVFRVEALERRELLAGDVFAHHNYIIPADVNRDFRVHPVDALMVINELNRNGSRTLPSDFDPRKGGALMDVNADGKITPLDALLVINHLNRGEGVGELVEFKYEFFAMDGTSLDPNPNDNIAEFQIGVGQPFIMRSSVKDLRANPLSVYSPFQDVVYRNEDGSAAEIVELQWGEYNLLKIGSTVRSGNFTVRFGNQTTAPISPVFNQSGSINKAATAAAIATAIGNLTFVGGEANLRVESDFRLDRSDTNFFHFGISFIGARARQNIPNGSIPANNLRDAANAQVDASISTNANPSPTQTDVFLTAFNFDARVDGAPQSPQYNQFADGVFANPSQGVFEFDDFGALSNIILGDVEDAGAFKMVWESIFVAARPGKVLFSGNYPDKDGTEILLLGESEPVPADLVIFPNNIPLTVVQDLIARNDVFPRQGQPPILEDSDPVTLNVTSNDQIFVGSSFEISAITQPANGVVAIASNRRDVTFRPNADFFGQTTFTYTIRSNLGATSTATVTVNVTGVNDPPTIIRRNFAVDEDPVNPLTINPEQIASPGPGEDGQALTFVSATPVPGSINGTLQLVNNQVLYRPAQDFFGTALFTVVIRDSEGLSTPSTTITVNVRPVNDPPIAFSGTLETDEDTPLRLIGAGATIDLLQRSSPGPENESDQTLSLVNATSPTTAGGTITTNSQGITTYRPANNFFGVDTFTYVIADSGNPSLQATGTITVNVRPVNDPPVAVNDTGANRFVVFGFANQFANLDVMRNDNPGPGESAIDSIRVVAVTQGSRGSTVQVGVDGANVRFRPAAGLVNVSETFTYTIEDNGGLRATATTEVFIIPPELPFAVDDVAGPVDEDSTNANNVITIDVLQNDLVNTGASKRLLSFTQPTSGGTVRLNNNGTPDNLSDDRLEFFAAPNVFRPVTFTYTMIDSAAGSKESIGTVTVTFNEINDPPTAVNRTFDGVEDTVLTIPASQVLAGLSKGPLEDDQTLTITAVNRITANGGTVRIGDDGNIIFSPAADFNGPFLFRYTVTDNGTTRGQPDPKSATATITVNVAAVNDPPVAGTDNFTTPEDVARTIAISALLSNDRPGPETATDEASQTISFKSFTGNQSTARGGTVRMSGQSLIYTPPTDFNGIDTFTYVIVDDGNPPAEGEGTVTIRVTEVNDPPIPVTIRREAFANLARPYDVSDEISRIAPGPANEASQTVVLIEVFALSETRGVVSLNSDGTINYRAPADGTSDRFGYRVRDNGTTNGVADPQSATGVVEIEIKPFQPSTISGVVWIDEDDNGEVENAELKLGGVLVVLTGRATGESQDIQPITYLTLANGTYKFDNLAPGQYKVNLVRPSMTQSGADWIGSRRDSDNIVHQMSFNIAVPGGQQHADRNFSVFGVTAQYANLVENIASSLYGKYPGIQNKGLYGTIDASGQQMWSSKKDSFGDSLYTEIVLSNDKSQAIVTRVDAGLNVYSAVVPRNRLVKAVDAQGNALVRVLADVGDLAWTPVNLASPPNFNSSAYLKTVERVFAQENWN